MKKKFLVILLISSFSLTACGKKEEETKIIDDKPAKVIEDKYQEKKENAQKIKEEEIKNKTEQGVDIEEPKEEEEEEIKAPVVKEIESNSHKDEETGLLVNIPEEWQDEIKLTEYDNQDFRTLSFSYQDSEDKSVLLMLINILSNSKSISEIEMLPNNKVIAHDKNYIYTVSQIPSRPYQEDTKDSIKYNEMSSEIDNIINEISFVNDKFVFDNKIEEKDETAKYEANIHYPSFKDNEILNKLVLEETQNILKSFKDKLSEDVIEEGPNSDLLASYRIKHFNDDVISIEYKVLSRIIGLDSLNNYSFILNYNLKENKELELDDLFKVSEEEYLEKISELAITDLTKQLKEIEADIDSDIFKEKTKVTTENYNNFSIVENGIQFYFDSLIEGNEEFNEFIVLIPYDNINDIIRK